VGLELLDKAFPLIVTLGLAVSIPLVFMGLSALLGPRRPNPAKLSPYECGIQNRSTSGDARERVNVKFYLSAVCFLVFDVEVAFLFPWAVWFSSAAAAGAGSALTAPYLAMAAFAGVLAFSWFYLLKRGALAWD
jgi:NADH-quinone oxidoreductase subunit A